MGVILTRKSTASSGASGGSGVYTQDEKLAIEMEMEFKASIESYYKELGYVDGFLTNVGIWYDPTKTIKIFNKDLTYSNEVLTESLLERISDGSLLLKLFEYDGEDNLTSVTVSAG